jgi:hypothetical protein
MISEETIEHYNSKLNIDLNNIKNLSASQKDRVRHYGSQAEALLTNKDFAMFVHHYKFDVADILSGIRGHSEAENLQRIAYGNMLTGIDDFVNSLKRAVYYKNKVGKTEVPN